MTARANPEGDATPDPSDVAFAVGFLLQAAQLATPQLTTGSRIGRYQVVRKLGQGSQGQVFLATDIELERQVALKVLPPLAGAGEHRESKALALLRHPGIVMLYDVLAHAGTEILVMEFIDGLGTLRENSAWLATRSTRQVAALVGDVAEALQAAHYVGIKHCDIKPDNVLLRRDGTPVLIDFGIARHNTTPVRAGIEGTRGYMAPELGQVGTGLPAADVYALGITLRECLVGPAPGRNARRVPGDLLAICSRATQPRPELRHSSPGELAKSLRRFEQGLPVEERPLSWPSRAVRTIARNPLAGAVGAVIVILLGAWAWTHLQQERRAAAQAWTAAHELARRSGEWQQAHVAAETALALGAADPMALRIGIIRCHMGLGDAPSALAQLVALESEPPGPHAATLRLIRSTVGIHRLLDLERGRRLVQEAVALGGLSPAQTSYARGYLAGSLPESIGCFRAAIVADPFMPEARMHLTCLLLIAGEIAEAGRELDRYRALYPTSQLGDCLEALFRIVGGDPAGAEELLAPLEDSSVIGPSSIRLLGAIVDLLRRSSRDLEDVIAAAHPPIGLRPREPGAPPTGSQRLGAAWSAISGAVPVASALLGRSLVPRDTKGIPQFSLPPAVLGLVRGMIRGAMLSAGEVTPDSIANLSAFLARMVEDYPIGYLHMLHGCLLGMAGNYADAHAGLSRARATPSVIPVRLLPEMWRLHFQIRQHEAGWQDAASVPPDVSAEARKARSDLLGARGLEAAHWSLLHAHATHFHDIGDARLIAASWRRALPDDPVALKVAALSAMTPDITEAVDALVRKDPENAGARALREALLQNTRSK
ncbi:MAG: serine/threonine protein kinase [Planctomycetes bacterium]|nr:serine/threonine protein kinase [Planctomycetota bacterium]